MGTSFSAPCDENDTLPVELVVNILSYLPLHDLVSCQLVDRKLNDIINGSQYLQHQIDTAVAGVMDNPNSTLSLLARRRALAQRQVAWDTCQPQNITSFKCRGYEDLAPRHDRNETPLRLNNLREKGKYRIISLAVCDDNDLIAMGSVSPLINTTGFHSPKKSRLDSFEVDLLCISSGGGEHPAAGKATLHIKNISRDDYWETRMKIYTNLLAVHFRCIASLHGLFPSELWIFDWKAGKKLACWKGKGYSAFQFLSNTVMAIGSEVFPTAAILELFTIPVSTCDAGPIAMTKILSLGLPSVDEGCRVAKLDFYHPPIDNVHIRDNCLFSNTTGTVTKPFIGTSSDDIIFASLNIGGSYGYDNISFVVHSSALLRLIPIPSHEQVQNTILWESWGPTVTRWHEDGVSVMDPFASGQRCILKPRGRTMETCSWELWDFNPYRVRRLGKNFALESEKASLSVETEPSCARSRGIKEGVYSSLPFVKTIPKQWSDYYSMGLYDDRMSGTKFDSGVSVVDHLYFG